jgi:hypothetical protein
MTLIAEPDREQVQQAGSKRTAAVFPSKLPATVCAWLSLVARRVRIVSAGGRGRVIAWPVISTGGSSTEGSSPDGSSTDAYRYTRAYPAIDTTAIDTTAINTNTSSIICGGVS